MKIICVASLLVELHNPTIDPPCIVYFWPYGAHKRMHDPGDSLKETGNHTF